MKKKYSEEEVLALFDKHGILIVTFTKANGDKRMMECCRNPELDPDFVPDPPKEGVDASGRKPVTGLCNVRELGVGWRSFYYAKIIDVAVPVE